MRALFVAASRLILVFLSVAMPSGPVIAQRPPPPEGLRDLMADLQSKDKLLRWNAAIGMGKLGPQASEAVKPLLDAYRKESVIKLRGEYLSAIAKIGPAGAKEAVPALLEILLDPKSQEPDSSVRKIALDAVLRLDPKGTIVPTIIRRALELEPSIALEIIDPVGKKMGSACVKELHDGMPHKSPDIRKSIVTSIIALSGEGFTEDQLQLCKDVVKLALADSEPMLWQTAIDALVKKGPKSVSYLPTIIEATKGAGAKERATIVKAIFRIDPELKESSPLVDLTLSDPEPSIRLTMINWLDNRPDMARAHVKVLANGMKSDSVEVRRATLESLLFIDPTLSKIADSIKQGLHDKESSVRETAISGVARLRGDGKRFLPALKPLLDDPDQQVRRLARLACYLIDTEALEGGLAGIPMDSFIPADTVVLLQLKFKTLLDFAGVRSPLQEKIKNRLKTIEVLKQFKSDPLQDITTATFALPALSGLEADKLLDAGGVLILRGNFARELPGKIVKAKQSDLGITIYAVCVSREMIIASTDDRKLVGLIDKALERKLAAGLSKELAKMRASIDDGAMLWLASSISAQFREILNQAGGLTGVTVEVKPGKIVTIKGVFYCKGNAEAQSWEMDLNNYKSFLPKDWDGKVNRQDEKVIVEIQVPVETFQEAIGSILSR